MMAPSVSFKEISAKFVSLTDPTVYRDVFRTQSNTYDGFFWISEVFSEIWQNSQENNRLRDFGTVVFCTFCEISSPYLQCQI